MFDAEGMFISTGTALTLLCLYLFLATITALIAYFSLAPAKPRTFSQRLADQSTYQSIIVPAFGALVTGLLVSLSASFFYTGVSNDQSSQLTIGGWLFFFAALTFLVTAVYILKLQPLKNLTQYPQGILAAVDEVLIHNPEAAHQLEGLKKRLETWYNASAALSLDWKPKHTAPRLNQAFSAIPQHQSLPWKQALVTVRRRRIYQAALRAAPWQFGWPLYLLAVLWSLVTVAELMLRQSLKRPSNEPSGLWC